MPKRRPDREQSVSITTYGEFRRLLGEAAFKKRSDELSQEHGFDVTRGLLPRHRTAIRNKLVQRRPRKPKQSGLLDSPPDETNQGHSK